MTGNDPGFSFWNIPCVCEEGWGEKKATNHGNKGSPYFCSVILTTQAAGFSAALDTADWELQGSIVLDQAPAPTPTDQAKVRMESLVLQFQITKPHLSCSPGLWRNQDSRCNSPLPIVMVMESPLPWYLEKEASADRMSTDQLTVCCSSSLPGLRNKVLQNDRSAFFSTFLSYKINLSARLV